MDYQALKAEIDSQTEWRNLTHAEIADLLNAVSSEHSVSRGVIASHEVFERFNATEYAAIINDAQKPAQQRGLTHLLSMGTLNPNDPNVAALVTFIFGANSQTLKNLVGNAQADELWRGSDVRKQPASRAQELGLGRVTPSDVAVAGRLA